MRQYRVYRSLIDTPVSVQEAQGLADAARLHGLSVAEVKSTVDLVQRALLENKWFGRPENEIRRATDWNGESK